MDSSVPLEPRELFGQRKPSFHLFLQRFFPGEIFSNRIWLLYHCQWFTITSYLQRSQNLDIQMMEYRINTGTWDHRKGTRPSAPFLFPPFWHFTTIYGSEEYNVCLSNHLLIGAVGNEGFLYAQVPLSQRHSISFSCIVLRELSSRFSEVLRVIFWLRRVVPPP